MGTGIGPISSSMALTVADKFINNIFICSHDITISHCSSDNISEHRRAEYVRSFAKCYVRGTGAESYLVNIGKSALEVGRPRER